MLLLVIGGSVADLGVGVQSAAAAPFHLLQVLEVDHDGGRRQTRRIRRSKFNEAKLQRFGFTGRIIRRPPWGRVKPVPIHSVSSWRFLQFSVWLCVGATIVRCSSRFCSVISRCPPSVWVFVR